MLVSGPSPTGVRPENQGECKDLRRSHESDLSDDGEDGDKPTKHQKLIESDMPWYSHDKDSASGVIHSSSQDTHWLLRAYNHNIPKAKFFAKIAPKSPPGIPSSQWERILQGDAVDLNQVLASLHHVIPDEERTGRLGDTEISFGVAEAKKHVCTAAEWSSAWRRASKAISFAFPHWRDKLVKYGDYIKSEFSAKLVTSHQRVILYDIAVRNEVGAGQHVLLTDTHCFTQLDSAIVMPDGVKGRDNQVSGKKLGSTSSSPAKSEICNKFNLRTCRSADTDCKY